MPQIFNVKNYTIKVTLNFLTYSFFTHRNSNHDPQVL